MEKNKKIVLILMMSVLLCFTIGPLVQADQMTNVKTKKQTSKNTPIWQITQEGTGKPVKWGNYNTNPRFAVYDAGTPNDKTDDLVLDKETGLTWERSPGSKKMDWYEAIDYANGKYLGGRMGWRLPTVEELASLVNPNQDPPRLPKGHPFINVPTAAAHWTITTRAKNTNTAIRVDFAAASPIGWGNKSDNNYVWCVRGGHGHDAY